jgi:hypothetical protein
MEARGPWIYVHRRLEEHSLDWMVPRILHFDTLANTFVHVFGVPVLAVCDGTAVLVCIKSDKVTPYSISRLTPHLICALKF